MIEIRESVVDTPDRTQIAFFSMLQCNVLIRMAIAISLNDVCIVFIYSRVRYFSFTSCIRRSYNKVIHRNGKMQLSIINFNLIFISMYVHYKVEPFTRKTLYGIAGSGFSKKKNQIFLICHQVCVR